MEELPHDGRPLHARIREDGDDLRPVDADRNVAYVYAALAEEVAHDGDSLRATEAVAAMRLPCASAEPDAQ